MNASHNALVPYLHLTGLHHSFGSDAVLNGVSLDLAAGEILCLVGPSGCGKSTLLRLIAGLEQVQQGGVYVGGELMANSHYHRQPEQRDVGLVFQDFALFPHLSVLNNVAFGLGRLSKSERKPRALAMLERVGLGARGDDFPHQLSGGQQQRVALARALAPKPRLLLLDEPFSNLDVRLRHRLRVETLQLLKASGIASILVTHDPDDAMFMADRIALMREGRVVQVGTPDELYQHPATPFATEFFGDVNRFYGQVNNGQVATALGKVAAPDLAEGTEAEVLIRPESILLADEGAVAEVQSRHQLGASSWITLSLNDPDGNAQLIQLQQLGSLLPANHTRVHLLLDKRGVFVFPRTSAYDRD
ncbi:MAG TPA: ABC transporter ATP-binding protein [Cellvibrionaceae bacterium]